MENNPDPPNPPAEISTPMSRKIGSKASRTTPDHPPAQKPPPLRTPRNEPTGTNNISHLLTRHTNALGASTDSQSSLLSLSTSSNGTPATLLFQNHASTLRDDWLNDSSETNPFTLDGARLPAIQENEPTTPEPTSPPFSNPSTTPLPNPIIHKGTTSPQNQTGTAQNNEQSAPTNEEAEHTDLNNEETMEEEEEGELDFIQAGAEIAAVINDGQGSYKTRSKGFNLEIKVPIHPKGEDAAKVKWMKIARQGLDPKYLHKSANPFDFIKEKDAARFDQVVNGELEDVDPLTKLIVSPGFKVLARVARVPKAAEVPTEKWILHACRSALDEAEIPLDSMIAIWNCKKPNYDWHVLILKKDAYDQLAPLRALYDPRSGATVLLRLWDLTPPPTQTFQYSGIINEEDTTPADEEASMTLFKQQLESALEPHKIQVTEIKKKAPSKKGPLLVMVTYTFDPSTEPFTLRPTLITEYNGRSSRRRIQGFWSTRCPICHSDAHPSACPWTTYEINGSVPDLWAIKNLNLANTRKCQQRGQLTMTNLK